MEKNLKKNKQACSSIRNLRVLCLYKDVTVLFIQGDEKKRGKITLRAKIWVDISIVLAPNKVMEEKKTNLVIVGVRIAS